MALVLLTLCTAAMAAKKQKKQELWPNGEVMDAWFSDTTKVKLQDLGRQYVLTNYGVRQGTTDIQTKEIQAVIDKCAEEGGGVIVVPKGTFYTGSLFFKQGTHLHLVEGAVLKGSERVHDFEIRAGSQHIESHGTLNAIEVIVETRIGIDEQRCRNARQMQRFRKLPLERILHEFNGLLRSANIQNGRIILG